MDGHQFCSYVNELDVPIIDLGHRTGRTDYIDFIQPDEYKYPVMKGIDKFGRQFICLKVTAFYNNEPEKFYYETFFQRYSDDPITWMGAGLLQYKFLHTYGGMRDYDFNVVMDLINGETVYPSDKLRYHNDHFNDDDHKMISLCLTRS